VVLRALRRLDSRIKLNDKCAVIGAGPIGHFCSQVLLSMGHEVSVFDKDKKRLELLKGKAKIFHNLKDLEKFDLIIEATGSKKVLEHILKQSRTDSTLLLLGFPYANINYDFEDLVANEKFIVGSIGGASQDFEKALELLPQIDTFHFTNTVMPLKEFSKAWDLQRSLKHLKIILKP
jgi:threonine dehydrogenase-like Zn-dependent dehydrogenase